MNTPARPLFGAFNLFLNVTKVGNDNCKGKKTAPTNRTVSCFPRTVTRSKQPFNNFNEHFFIKKTIYANKITNHTGRNKCGITATMWLE